MQNMDHLPAPIAEAIRFHLVQHGFDLRLASRLAARRSSSGGRPARPRPTAARPPTRPAKRPASTGAGTGR